MKTKKTNPPKKSKMHWNRSRLNHVLDKWKGIRVLVVGDVGIDRYTLGTVERISPEAPVPVVHVQSEELKLGLAANVAANVMALGGVPTLIGVIGNDFAGQDLKRILRANGMDSGTLVVDSNRRTVLKDRIVTERQQLLRVDHESLNAVRKSVENQILKKFVELLPDADFVILQDYAKGLIGEDLCRSLFGAAKKAKKLVAVDPNVKTPLKFYRGAFLFKPNLKEAEGLTGIRVGDEASLRQVGQEILNRTKAQYVVITRGKEGMAVFSANKKGAKYIPTFSREVYDVSGAGDTVISVLSLALATGASIDDAAILGNLAAGVEVAKRGTATVNVDEIMSAMKSFEN